MTAALFAAVEAARFATARDATLAVTEVFGPTIQGEGPSMGRRCSFVRLPGCNLHCSWCDTPYTWDASRYDLRAESTRRPVRDILTELRGHDTGLLVVSGGEPLLHQRQPGWRALLGALPRTVDVEVETNGTQVPDSWTRERVTRFNVSPKLGHADDGRDPEHKRIVPPALAMFARLACQGRAAFKFVCRQPGDLEDVAELTAAHGIPHHTVWIMPEGVTADAVLEGARRLADPAIAAGFNLTTRLHTLVWGQERAR